MVYSKLLNRYYEPDNNNVCYITNMIQCAKYLKHGASDDLVDILFTNNKNENSLVFVFEKTPTVKALYKKWQNHDLD